MESSSNVAITMIGFGVVVGVVTTTLSLWHLYNTKEGLVLDLEKEKKKRIEERTGRTRAEKKLRDLISSSRGPPPEGALQNTHHSNNQSKDSDITTATTTSTKMLPDRYDFVPIGYVKSPFRDRRGTPRQASLTSHSFSYIEFGSHVSALSSLSSLELFSHVWVLGVFHENTNSAKRCTGKGIPTKIRPPRLGKDEKVGIYSTRTPHRHNPISLSLAKIEKIETVSQKAKSVTRLWLSGLDLIHDTPVLDIKPYIHCYDSVEGGGKEPEWISIDDSQTGFKFQKVEISEKAEVNFQEQVLQCLEFYPSNDPSCFLEAVKEILSFDIRSQYQRALQQKEGGGPVVYSLRFDVAVLSYVIEGGVVLVINITKEQEM